jgi:hypothetical protein
MAEKRILYRILVGKCTLDKPRQKLEAKINVDIMTTDYADQKCMELAHDCVQ